MQSIREIRFSKFNFGKSVLTSRAAVLALGALVIFGGCGKSNTPAPETKSAAAPAPVPAAAPAAAPAAPVVNADGSSADTTAKLAAADWAVKQDEIKNDANGEWAILATASSSYNDAQGQSPWSPNQATGLPNVDKYGDDGKAWTSKTPDSGIEWLDLKYPKAIHATEARIRESCGSGAIIKVELFDESGTSHVVWAGNDPTTGLNYLMVKFAKTAFKSDHMKITLATNVIPGWNEIDAAQLVGTDQ
jgi:hypothetical protein